MTFRLWLDLADTLMIRDGRPFNQDDAGRAAAASLFPPPPATIYGAARVGLARAMGWDGAGNWGGKIADALGSWSKEGDYRCAGPFFAAHGRDLLPVPAHVYAAVDRHSGVVSKIVTAVPGAAMHTDAGEMPMLALPECGEDERSEPLAGRWAPADQVIALLTGGRVTPGKLRRPKCCDDCTDGKVRLACIGWRPDDLAAKEPRVGLERISDTRLAREGRLYVSTRRRLHPRVCMFAEIGGMDPAAMNTAGIAVPIGGEARFALMETGEAPAPYEKEEGNLIYCATPFLPDRAQAEDRETGGPLARLLPPFAAAAVPGVALAAGYRRTAADKDATGSFTTTRPVIPAGTVFFLDDSVEITPWRERCEDRHMGYGRLIAGDWYDDQ